jgi:hypothetical protein
VLSKYFAHTSLIILTISWALLRDLDTFLLISTGSQEPQPCHWWVVWFQECHLTFPFIFLISKLRKCDKLTLRGPSNSENFWYSRIFTKCVKPDIVLNIF